MAAYTPVTVPDSFGKIVVATPGTPVRLTSNLTGATGNVNSSDDLWCNRIEIAPNSANTGLVYIGRAGMVRATLVGVFMVLAKTAPPWILVDETKLNPYHAGDFWVDVDTANDYVFGNFSCR